ncbi:HupE/UreJ family protein [Pseudoneobacillus sp. C159]
MMTRNRNKLALKIYYIIIILSLVFPEKIFAHAYSSSFTEIKFMNDMTELTFSLDTLSLLELMEDMDQNQNGILEESELQKNEHHVEELIHSSLVLDKNGQQQEGKLAGMKIEKKEQGEYVTFAYRYPTFYPGDTISITDGLYVNDSATNYINLISAENRGETGQAVLQGENRTWTVLLTENQVEQEVPEEGAVEQPESGGQAGVPNEGPHMVTKSNSSWVSFFKLGMLHILTGYDHLLFLLALLLRKQSFKQYAAIVTSFTIAHSITISLAVLGAVNLPSRFVEAAIAFSICYVAAENLFRHEIRYRWGLTFLFGLIHGLGFANILKEMNIGKGQLVSSLLSFNIGIEVVQLILVLLVLPLLSYMHRLPYSKKIVQIGSVIIIVLGGFWFMERIFS